ncbi:class I SAM-dependent methyltransferase [Nocardioides sp. KIGAM211]|uniref:Class I SAM-dependent methyltransferase n=1 Tax=Nocardioides luti TaxID=2761101 RepID=A0A7X0RJJ1_9ACTN|nr:class I SAM-dependent methyltransferase [Nocardioides luti]MBB6629481.1 class I SAM-dependent methyltransferase [Nocardioides luti]
MSTGYALAYRLGVTPWEKAGAGADAAFQALLDREEADRVRPWGRALDLGCGTGAHTRQLEARGWDALGVDNVRQAVDTAVRRGGPDSRFVIGDVAHLKGCGVGADFSLFLDVGCFHGLKDAQRLAMGRGVTSIAAPHATLLMLAFTPHRNKLLPRGADTAAVTTAYPDWDVLSVDDADTSGMPAPLRKHTPRWFRLRLR